MTRSRARLMPLLLGVLLLTAGCARDARERAATSDGEAETADRVVAAAVEQVAKLETFVGKVEGTDAYIAVSVLPDRVLAYLCDGKQLKQWFDGSAPGNRIEARDDSAQGSLTATLAGEVVTGSVSVRGSSHRFFAERARRPAGLYVNTQYPTPETRGAWIVLPDGTQRGAATKAGVPVESTVSPSSGEADIGGETVSAGAGGSTGTPIPTKTTCASLRETFFKLAEQMGEAIKSKDIKRFDAIVVSMNAIELEFDSRNCGPDIRR